MKKLKGCSARNIWRRFKLRERECRNLKGKDVHQNDRIKGRIKGKDQKKINTCIKVKQLEVVATEVMWVRKNDVGLTFISGLTRKVFILLKREVKCNIMKDRGKMFKMIWGRSKLKEQNKTERSKQ